MPPSSREFPILAWAFGPAAAIRAHVVPVFFVFPVAFTLNRLGQHYDIDPADPAKWGTLGNPGSRAFVYRLVVKSSPAAACFRESHRTHPGGGEP